MRQKCAETGSQINAASNASDDPDQAHALLSRRFQDLFGGMTGDGGSPSLQQSEHDGDQGRPDEQAQEAEGEKAAEDTQDGKRHRHLDAEADQPGLDEIVDCADEQAPDDHKHAPKLLVLRK
jgi:hypothetical protein